MLATLMIIFPCLCTSGFAKEAICHVMRCCVVVRCFYDGVVQVKCERKRITSNESYFSEMATTSSCNGVFIKLNVTRHSESLRYPPPYPSAKILILGGQ